MILSFKSRTRERKFILERANRYESEYAKSLGLPVPAPFQSYRELKNHLESLQEPTIWAKTLIEMCKETEI